MFCFPKSRINANGGTVTLPGCLVSRDHQACFVNWFCSSYLYINTKETDFDQFYIFLNDLRIFDRSKFFLVTRFSVTSLLVTRYFVTLFSNTPIIPLALVGYEMIIANSALRVSLAFYHLISNARSWNNC